MNSISSSLDAALTQSSVQSSLAVGNGLALGKGRSSEEVREAFTQFVGQTFYGQMLKAMRSTVGKPAYFHGGRGEEVFQSQLDQTLAEHMTEASAESFAEPMFRLQFPHLAESAKAAKMQASEPALGNRELDRLAALSRR
jgi:Rod binding domain-containing protein